MRTPEASTPPPRWWACDATLNRFARDVLQGELAALRPAQPWPARLAWHAGLHWRDDLGVDSLDMMALSAAFTDAMGVTRLDAVDTLYEHPTLDAWLAVARNALDVGAPMMRFRTSGSTGAPRSCVHAMTELMQEMQAMAAVIGAVQRIVAPVRCHHIYGFLFTVLLPHAMGRPDLPVLDLVGRPPAALGASLQAGDLIVGFPDWWAAIARHMPAWPEGVTGITSTAPCPPDLGDALLASGLPRLLHIYGSTETAGIGWKDHGQACYHLHPFWSRVQGHDDRLLRQTPDGATRTVDAPDHLAWDGDRLLRPDRRRDQAVQVGGVNVQPAWVADRLRMCPGVAAAAVRPMEAAGRTRLKAFVVPADHGTPSEALVEQVQAWSRRHLPPAARPAHVTVGNALPVNGMGKACDWAVEP